MVEENNAGPINEEQNNNTDTVVTQNTETRVETSDNPTDTNSHDRVGIDRDDGWFIRTRNIIYYVLGFIEVLLAFRLIFRSLGASISNPLVLALYSFTKVLISPFIGIFNVIVPGGTTAYVIEPATIIAMIVYALVAVGIVRLIKVTTVRVD